HHGGRAGRVPEHLEGDEAGVGGDARPDQDVVAVGHLFAGGGAGDVGAVSVHVQGIGVRLGHGLGRIIRIGVVDRPGEVVAVDDLGVEGRGVVRGIDSLVIGGIATSAQGGVGVVDARVDHGDDRAVARRIPPHLVGADEGDAVVVDRHVLGDRCHAEDPLGGTDGGDVTCPYPCVDAI